MRDVEMIGWRQARTTSRDNVFGEACFRRSDFIPATRPVDALVPRLFTQEALSDVAMLWYDQGATDQTVSFTKPPQHSSVAQWQSIRLLTGGL